jgi:two-component system cell cycle sensor histidine kinase/response regulator CckA
MTSKLTYEELEKRFEELEKEAAKRKEVEEALQQSEERYPSGVEGAIQAILIIQDSIIQFANRAAARIFGYSNREELIGLNIIGPLVAPQERAELRRRGSRVLSGKSVPIHHWQGIRKDGTQIWIQSTLSLTSWKKKPAILSSLTDITERKLAAEQMLEKERNLLSTVIDNVPDYIYMKDTESRYLVSNNAFVRFLGAKTPDEVIGKTPFELYPEEMATRYYADDQEVIRSGRPLVNREERSVDQGRGKLVWNLTTKVPLRDGQRKVVGLVGVARDITEKKQAEEEKERLQTQLQQAQKMEAIGTLAGGIAHNFNNLLMGIIGNTSMMLLDTDSSHPNRERLENIEKSVQNASKLTSQLLRYARQGGYEIRPIGLNQLVKETSDTFAMTKKEIRVHQELSKDLFRINGEQGQIEQILLNLYVNAADAMRGGGDLFLKTMNATPKHMKGKPYKVKPGNHVLLTVRDTGIGMDKRTQERIFDPFFTTKGMGRGMGLGLASVYGIIKAHGGYIDVESKKGHGTTFRIYLPASSEKEVIKEKELPEKILKGKETILLVDDEDIVLDVGEQMLKTLGYKLSLAKSGREAIELYNKNRDTIDMVLLDMIMPDMGGGEAYDRMKEINPDIKVLLSSGYSIDGQATEILKRGCDGFIQKPFHMQELSQRVRKILDKT